MVETDLMECGDCRVTVTEDTAGFARRAGEWLAEVATAIARAVHAGGLAVPGVAGDPDRLPQGG